MRVLITGSRTWSDTLTIAVTLAQHDPDTGPVPTLVSGHCLPRTPDEPPGADLLCEQEAERLDWRVERHPADWPTCGDECPRGHRRRDRAGRWYCPWAGRRRNQHMADLGADLCRAFHLGTPGTRDMIKRAKRAGIPTRIIRPGAVSVSGQEGW